MDNGDCCIPSVLSLFYSYGWMVKNILHLQQTVGHEKSGEITKRYLHMFPLSSISYVIDGLKWES